ncbi:MAG: Dipeptidyl-peptidase 5 [Planctomycetes bacterium]|nr:Dipeptidyl-peptidase 5 [Planctomycetota bacterium]
MPVIHDARHAPVHAPVPGVRRLDADTLWKIPRVGAPVPSPDGSCALVTVTTWDIEADKGRSRIWAVPADGSPPRPVTSPDHDASAPAWSPDGNWIAFLRKGAEKDAKPQVHLMPSDGGEAEKLTDYPVACFDPCFAPDGRSLVFGVKLLRGFGTVESTRAEKERREREPCKAIVTEERVFRFWDQWLEGGDAPHLFAIDLATRKARDLMPSSTLWFPWMEPSGSWDISPDGRTVAFQAQFIDRERDLLRTGVFTVPFDGSAAPLCITPDHPAGAFHPRFTPDGSRIVYGVQEDPFFYADRVRLESFDPATGARTRILDWDLSVGGWEFAADGTLWSSVEKDARVSLFRWNGTGLPVEAVRGGSAGAGRPAGDGSLWFNMNTISEPTELWRIAPGETSPRKMTSFTAAAMEGVALGEVRELRCTGADGVQVQTFVVFPPGVAPDDASRLPLVHVVHGGPHGISGDQFHPRWNAHVFAHPGHVVAMVNFQGSTSWGQEFGQCIQGEWGRRPFIDVMNATDAVAALGWCDPQRMAATGASYGGYLVSWIAGHTDRFRCIVNHAGVFDSWSQYASDVTQGRARAFGGEPWDRIETLDLWSPARYAKDMKTPMLVTHGEKDYRVPIGQGLECYSILKAKGVPARLVYFPDENHWILKPRNSLLWHREVFAWLARWLG